MPAPARARRALACQTRGRTKTRSPRGLRGRASSGRLSWPPTWQGRSPVFAAKFLLIAAFRDGRRWFRTSPLACEAWRSLPLQTQKCLQITGRDTRARWCSGLGLIRASTAGFGPTNGPTAGSTHGIWRRRIVRATVASSACAIVTPVSSTSTTVLPSTGMTPSLRCERSAFADSDGGNAVSARSAASMSKMRPLPGSADRKSLRRSRGRVRRSGPPLRRRWPRAAHCERQPLPRQPGSRSSSAARARRRGPGSRPCVAGLCCPGLAAGSGRGP